MGRRAISTPHHSIMSNIDDLRAELRKTQRAVNRKMRRNEKAHGIDQWGTHDVRIDRAKIDRYNTPQLRSAIERQRDFLSRKRQFVGGYNGAAISRDAYQNYVKTANEHNEELARRRASWDRKTMGRLGYLDYTNDAANGGNWQKGGGTNFTTHGFEKVGKPKDFHSERAVKRTTDKLARMFTAREIARSRREGKKTLLKMAKDSGSVQLIETINRMRGAQIDYVLDSPTFMHAMKTMYVTGDAMREEDPTAFSKDLHDESLDEAIELLDDVEKHVNPRGGRFRNNN